MIEQIKNWDTQLFVFLNGIHSPFWDNIMFWISKTNSWIPLYLVLVGLIIYKQRKRALLTLLFIGLLILISDQVSVHFFKNVFQRLRPCHTPELQDIVHLVKNRCGGKYGFVSSHASNTFAIAGFLSFLFRYKPLTVFLFLWAAVVSYSRIYLGVHFPLDVACGAILGFSIGYMVYRAYSFANKRVYKQT